MRHLILLSLACLSLTACGKEESTQDIQQVDQALASDDLVDNDLTAIDAITGADSDMAADVDPSSWNNDKEDIVEGGSNGSAGATRKTERPAPTRSSNSQESTPETTASAPQPAASNSADGED